MKARKKLNHNNLVTEVSKVLFLPQVQPISGLSFLSISPKNRKAEGFLMVSGSMEREHWSGTYFSRKFWYGSDYIQKYPESPLHEKQVKNASGIVSSNCYNV